MNSSLIQLHIHRCASETGSFFILSKGVSQCNSDVIFPGGQKNPSNINQVLFCYSIKNLLKRKKNTKVVSNFAFPADSGPCTIPISALPCNSTSLTIWEFPLVSLGNSSADTGRYTLVQANKPGSSAPAPLGCPVQLHSPRASTVPQLWQLMEHLWLQVCCPQKSIIPAWPSRGVADSPMSPKLLSHHRAVFSTHQSFSHTHTSLGGFIFCVWKQATYSSHITSKTNFSHNANLSNYSGIYKIDFYRAGG